MKTETKTAIVTGASSGIGLGITQALLERGWSVVATSRAISKSDNLKPTSDLVLVDGDAGKKETALKVVEAALNHFDVLICSSTMPESTFRGRSPTTLKRTTIW